MNRVTVFSLLGTGSLVSPVTESFFHEHFATWGHECLQFCHWLQLLVANGLAIPFIGYLKLDIILCGKEIRHCGVLVVDTSNQS